MRPRKGRVHRLGFRLALVALAVQAAIPLLLAVALRASAAASADVVIASSLCLHDGSTQRSDPAPHQNCPPSNCAICTALAAAVPLVVAVSVGLAAPVVATESLFPVAALLPSDGTAASPYRSRAPPLV